MKGTTELYLRRSIIDGFITVPSYFNNIRRLVVHDAGRIAGFSSIGSTTFEGTSANVDASVQNIVNPNRNINRPLSPHLSIYEPQLTSTYSIFNRISGAFLTAVVLSGILFALEIGPLSLTYTSLYQSSFYANFGNYPKLTLSLVNFTLLAFCYHLANGIRHICWDMGLFMGSSRIIRVSEFLMLCIAFSAFAKIIQNVYF
uniref:Succinate dehydrogenase cytochrome subunit 3 n=1 Tax=Taxus cuspidata TaxID=99806 RepID=A0A6B9XMT0_TAXCU|nr:succinate dehydrogenase cytochrome subunit 3 [Taxus cuspidata]